METERVKKRFCTLSDNNYGFRKGAGAGRGILNIRKGIHRSGDTGPSLALCGEGFAPRSPTIREDSAGNLLIGNSLSAGSTPRQLGDHLRNWSHTAPDRLFLAERRQGEWHGISYREARLRVDALSQGLIDLGLDDDRPLACIAENSVRYALLKLAAMQIGIAVQPISTAYAGVAADFRRLDAIMSVGNPAAVYVPSLVGVWPALEATAPRDCRIICDDIAREPIAAIEAARARQAAPPLDLAYLESVGAGDGVEQRYRAVTEYGVAKILMTSGSTGSPKGVIITQGTMAANGAAVDALWPFLRAKPPVLVDWLPWSHTFGTNFNLTQILRHGGTLYIDEGRPVPGRFDATLRNLASVKPTLLYNVPRGFDMLIDALESDGDFAAHLLEELDIIFYAGAALSPVSWRRLEKLALAVRGEAIPILSSLGSTETGPVATLSHWIADAPNSIGLPVPGTEIRLVPAGDKLEMRVRGPSVTPGYYRAPDATAAAFDELGFFRLGDAVRIGSDGISAGLEFDGRISENFKLLSGNWVNVGALRADIVDRIGSVVRDAVIAGHDRDEIRMLLIPGADAASLPATEVARRIADGLARHNRIDQASSRRVGGAMMLPVELSVDAGEITDKGYINQRAVLSNHAALVERLYAKTDDAGLIRPGAPT